MTPQERVVATNAAAEMALAILQASRFGAADPEQFGEGLYRAARAMIDRACVDPNLSPDRIALAIGCSRATLYRLFARHDVLWTLARECAAVPLRRPQQRRQLADVRDRDLVWVDRLGLWAPAVRERPDPGISL